MSANFIFSPTSLDGVVRIEPKQFSDTRGSFTETYSAPQFAEAGITDSFIQDDLSFSREGVLRGLHFASHPHETAKLVRCVEGEAFDVVVDLRVGSRTFGKHESFELSGENGLILYVPRGFAHGFCALSDVLMAYKITDIYRPECDAGIRYDDPELGIAWPRREFVLSDKDKGLPSFKQYAEQR